MQKYMDIKRIKEVAIYLTEMAKRKAECLKENRKIGSAIICNKKIIAEGYNRSSIRGSYITECERINFPPNQGTEFCKVVHAEVDCIISFLSLFNRSERNEIARQGVIFVSTMFPCSHCANLIVYMKHCFNITKLYYLNDYYKEKYKREIIIRSFLDSGIFVEKIIL